MDYNYSVEFNEKKQILRLTKVFWPDHISSCPVIYKDGWDGISFLNKKSEAEAYLFFLQMIIDENKYDKKIKTDSIELENIDSNLQDFILKYNKP